MKVRSKAALVLYTYIDRKLHFILSRASQQENFGLLRTDVSSEDTAPTFALTRLMISDYLGIFTMKNMEKLAQKQKLTKEEVRTAPLKWYQLVDSPDYHEWLENLTEEEVILHSESDEGEIVYFIEIKHIDVDTLNGSMKDLNLPLEFAYYNYVDKSPKEVEAGSMTLFNRFNFDEHIKTTLKAYQEGNFSYYLILSIKDMSTNKKDQAGFFHFPALFEGLYRDSMEKWQLICAGNLVFPSEEVLSKTKAIIIPGSALNIYNDVPFVNTTAEWLKNVFHVKYPKIKFMGICFGEQLICHALGGKVEKLESKEFVRAPNHLKIIDEFWDLPFIKKSGIVPKKEYIISQAHGDEVTVFPDFMKNYASSDTCKNEVLVSNDHRYLLIQGHPEYVPQFTFVRVYKFFLSHLGVSDHSPESLEKVKKDMFSNPNYLTPDAAMWRGVCYSFLKS
jgi:GMP synthase-like glutamine amidotransferase